MAARRREAFFVDGAGPEPELFEQGLQWLIDTSRAHGATTAYLVVPKLSQLIGTISDVIGESAARTLMNGEPVRLIPGVQLMAYSERTLARNPIRGPILAAYCTPKEMTQIDMASGDSPIAMLPWVEREGNQWIAKHRARKIGNEDAQPCNPSQLTNPVVEQALLDLTARVNLSTGIAHPLDRDKAVHLFRILKRNREQISFDELGGWFVAHHWGSHHADELTQMAQDIFGGKRIQAGSNPWGNQVIRVWRRRAKVQDQDEEIDTERGD